MEDAQFEFTTILPSKFFTPINFCSDNVYLNSPIHECCTYLSRQLRFLPSNRDRVWKRPHC